MAAPASPGSAAACRLSCQPIRPAFPSRSRARRDKRWPETPSAGDDTFATPQVASGLAASPARSMLASVQTPRDGMPGTSVRPRRWRVALTGGVQLGRAHRLRTLPAIGKLRERAGARAFERHGPRNGGGRVRRNEPKPCQISGHEGDQIEAYLARPLDRGPHGAVVVIHHMPGYDRQTKRSLAASRSRVTWRSAPTCTVGKHRGPAPTMPRPRFAPRAAYPTAPRRRCGWRGALPRASSSSNGKVATIGYCSGGRQSFLAACSLELDAAVDCYGAFVVGSPPEGLSQLKVTPIVHLTAPLSCPLLGLFGADDQHPTGAR